MATATHTPDSAAFIDADFSELKTKNLFACGYENNEPPFMAMASEIMALANFAEANVTWFEWNGFDGIPDGSVKTIRDVARLYYLVVAVIGMANFELVEVMDNYADDPSYFEPDTDPGKALAEIKKILPYWDQEYAARVENSCNVAAMLRLHGAG
tara:strand:+ start:606 stop:1070 length:465 start_codon:yes stop_codon:yes gene_type:complete